MGIEGLNENEPCFVVGRETFCYVLYTFTNPMCMDIKVKKSIDCGVHSRAS